MKGYWWECTTCSKQARLEDVTDNSSVAGFIWDVLIPSNWDQRHILQNCKKCKTRTMHIAYEFPRKKPVKLFAKAIVGLTPQRGDEYVPMVWEAAPGRKTRKRWIDFKYVNGRSSFGLYKPAIFDSESLREVLDLFEKKTGRQLA